MKRVVVGVGLLVAVALALWHSFGSRPDEAPHAVGSASHVGHATHVVPGKQPRASIAGTITDAKHVAITGARVCAFGRNKDYVIPETVIRAPRCTLSDVRGAYAISNLVAADYQVSAMARQYKPARYHPVPLELHAAEAKIGVDIAMEHGGAELQGTVSDRTGGPIPHANVMIVAEAEGSTSVETDDAGHYVAWVHDAVVAVTAIADGYAAGGADGVAPGVVDVALMPAATIEGTVIDLATNAPVPGAAIFASRNLGAYDFEPDEISDEQGRFKLDRLSAGRYTVLARGANRTGTADGSYLVSAAQSISGLVIKVGPTYRVEGKVVVADAPGTVCKQPQLSLALHRYAAELWGRAGDNGAVVATGALPGTYEVHAGCRGYISKESLPDIVVSDHDLSGLVWEVTTGASIHGHIRTSNGEPIPNAVVEDSSVGGVTSEADGSYKLEGLRPGPHKLTASATHSAPTRSPPTVTIHGHETVEQDLVLEDGVVVRGTVVDGSGKPLPRASVFLTAIATGSNQSRGETLTSASGSFELAPVLSGQYTIRAGIDRDVVDQTISVDASHPIAVRLVLATGVRGAIRGTVLDDRAESAADAMVSVARENEYSSAAADRYYKHDELPAPDGTFVIDHLDAGTYTVRAQRSDGSVGYTEHVVLGSTVRVQLQPVGSIEGEVRGGTSPELLIGARDSKTSVRRAERLIYGDGHFALRGLPPGHYIVTARSNQQTLTQTVDLALGEHKTIVFEASAGVTITGRVIDLATGAPLPDRQVFASVTRGELGDLEEPPKPVRTDTAGRFRIDHVPAGTVFIYAEGDPKYAGSSIVRTIRGDADVGDLGAAGHRILETERGGKLGITWVNYADETPSDQRHFEIAAIDPKSPAAGTELQVGDVVTTFDGIQAAPNNRSACWTILEAPVGTAIKLGLARGPIVTVVVAPP